MVMGPEGPQGKQGVQGIQGVPGEQGVPGQDGLTPDIQVGDVATLPAGSAATVVRKAGSPDAAPVFDFGIPAGKDADMTVTVKPYYRRFEKEDWTRDKLLIPASTHKLSTDRAIITSTLHMLVGRSAEDFKAGDLDEAKTRFIAAQAAALAANTATPGTYPTAGDGHVELTREQVQYYLLEQTLVSAQEAAAKAAELGFDWWDIDTSGVHGTVSLDTLLSRAYIAALGGSSATLDQVWTVEVLRGLRLRWAVEGVTGRDRKYDCVGVMTASTWAVMESRVYMDTDTGMLTVESEGPFAGELLVLAGG